MKIIYEIIYENNNRATFEVFIGKEEEEFSFWEA